MKKNTRITGFTMIELMVTVVIVAILATIAAVSYQSQITQSRRTDAINAVFTIALAEESYRTTHTGYTSSLGSSGLNVSNSASSYAVNYYTITAATVTGGYQITATASGTQTSDAQGSTSCAVLSYTMENGTAYLNSSSSGTPTVSATQSPCWPS